jgi:hypothetical protein
MEKKSRRSWQRHRQQFNCAWLNCMAIRRRRRETSCRAEQQVQLVEGHTLSRKVLLGKRRGYPREQAVAM